MGYQNEFTQGSNTMDKLFAISYRDYKYYSSYSHLYSTTATAYAQAQGAPLLSGQYSAKYTPYWLRTPVNYTWYDEYAGIEKTINYALASYYNTYSYRKVDTDEMIAVRPAMYVDLSNPVFIEECFAYEND